MSDSQEVLHAPEVELASNVERRACLRFLMGEQSDCPPVVASLAGQPETHWIAKLADISRGGLALLMAWPIEAGTLLAVELPDKVTGELRSFLARVVHARLERTRRWRIGCEFAHPLSEDELQSLVAG